MAYELNSTTVLPTALIQIDTSAGLSKSFRVLIDQGSTASFISERAVRELKLQSEDSNTNIHGISCTTERANGRVTVQISPRFSSHSKTVVNAIVLNELTTLLPLNDVNKAPNSNNILKGLLFADPIYNISDRVDMILGADIFSRIVLSGVKKSEDNTFILQETIFGWIISGSFQKKNESFRTIEMSTPILAFDPFEPDKLKKVSLPNSRCVTTELSRRKRKSIDEVNEIPNKKSKTMGSNKFVTMEYEYGHSKRKKCRNWLYGLSFASAFALLMFFVLNFSFGNTNVKVTTQNEVQAKLEDERDLIYYVNNDGILISDTSAAHIGTMGTAAELQHTVSPGKIHKWKKFVEIIKNNIRNNCNHYLIICIVVVLALNIYWLLFRLLSKFKIIL